MTPTEDDLVALSEWIAGDLPPEHAARLAARVRTEPALAAAWQRMQGIVADLEALPPTDAPAPEVRLGRRRRTAWVVPLALAAGLVGVVAARPDPVALTVRYGSHDVDGRVDVAAPGTRVEVDGKVRVTVEPETPVARSPSGEGAMKRSFGSAALGAVGGAVVTVVVLEGSAIVTSEGGPPLEVPAGTTHVAHAGAPSPRPPEVTRVALEPEVDRYVAALEARVSALEMENTFVKGQLQAFQGVAAPWPAEVHALVSPEGFQGHLERAIGGIEGLTLQEVRCDEYPCVALVTGSGTEDELRARMQQVNASLDTPDEVAALISAGIRADDSDPDAPATLLLGVSLLDAQDAGDDRLGPRIQQRLRDAEEEYGSRADP